MRVALLTHYLDNWRELGDLVRPQRERYCARHGYQHVEQVGPYGDPALYYAIGRLRLVRDLLTAAGGPDLIWVLNVAAVITNEALPITAVVPMESDRSVFIQDHGGPTAPINAGSLVLRRAEGTLRWLDMVIEKAPAVTHVWRENLVMIETLEEWRHVVQVVPQPGFNSLRHDLYGRPRGVACDYQPGHLVVHFPGLPYETRLAAMKEMLACPTT